MAMARMTFGDLDIAVIDPHARDTEYIYDEIFKEGLYEHPRFRVPEGGVVMDVGANIGLYTIWASRKWRPGTVLAYEASPATFPYLVENAGRHVDRTVTRVVPVNQAVSARAGEELTLHQAPLVSGISTMLGGDTVGWVRELAAKGEIVAHRVTTTTVSAEIARHGLARIDMLKIDVEGHFMEVLAGIAPADWPRIGAIVLETEYLAELALTADGIARDLAGTGFATEVREQSIYAWRP